MFSQHRKLSNLNKDVLSLNLLFTDIEKHFCLKYFFVDWTNDIELNKAFESSQHALQHVQHNFNI